MAKKKTLPEEELNATTVPAADAIKEQQDEAMEAVTDTASAVSPAGNEPLEDALSDANKTEP